MISDGEKESSAIGRIGREGDKAPSGIKD